MEGLVEVVEVKKSLKDLRAELKNHRASSTMPVSKLSRASVMAELSKYSSAPPVSVGKPKDLVKPDDIPNPSKKKLTNSKVKVSPVAEVVPKKVAKAEPKAEPKPVAKAEPKAEPKAEGKKPLTQYQKLWGEARRKGMTPKEASDFAKSKLA